MVAALNDRPPPTFDLLAAARNLLVDRLIAELDTAFEKAGIEHVLLKGPAIAGWLYSGVEVRAYNDGDFLVSHRRWGDAVALLVQLGFRDAWAEAAHPNLEGFASHPWIRDVDNVDLHATLAGITSDFDTAWSSLARDTTEVLVAGRPVRVLGEPARAFHLALHAAHHHEGKAMIDLERGLERLGESVWEGASEIATQLGATAAFATGLRLLPAGDALARRLGVGEARSAAATLKVESVPLAEGFEYLANASGLGGKLTLIWKELFPSPEFLRWWSPSLAQRGRSGLAAAYLHRAIWLVAHFPAGFRAWRRARREAG